MHISVYIGPKVHILFQLVFSSEFVTFWGVTRAGGGPRPKITKCDIKNIDILVTYFVNGP